MGVEEECFLVGPATGEAVPPAGEVVRGAAADMGDPVSREPGRYQEESALPAVLVRASTVTGLRAVERGDPDPGSPRNCCGRRAGGRPGTGCAVR
ncbi:hypothetical protein ACFU6R_14770 [Streptomyces sp. NPDC057499]|uniref:hypothetical protein n=1 Tax=Streptomyces sp. NPDC057499 TaxID=3346150 RepID=UPI0036CCF27C